MRESRKSAETEEEAERIQMKAGMIIKIMCTEEEKIQIIEAFMNSLFCMYHNDKAPCLYSGGCFDCFEKSIEWQIIEEHDKENKQ